MFFFHIFTHSPRTMDNVSVSSGSSSTSGAADGDELSAVLNRRQKINEALEDGKPLPPQFPRRMSAKNVYLEFKEFSRKQINEYEMTFKKYVPIYIFLYLPLRCFFFLSGDNAICFCIRGRVRRLRRSLTLNTKKGCG